MRKLALGVVTLTTGFLLGMAYQNEAAALSPSDENYELYIDCINDLVNGSQSLKDNVDLLVNHGENRAKAETILKLYLSE